MIYGNIDVMKSQKGRKKKRSSKILDIFPFQKTSSLLVAGNNFYINHHVAWRYFESGNERTVANHERQRPG